MRCSDCNQKNSRCVSAYRWDNKSKMHTQICVNPGRRSIYRAILDVLTALSRRLLGSTR